MLSGEPCTKIPPSQIKQKVRGGRDVWRHIRKNHAYLRSDWYTRSSTIVYADGWCRRCRLMVDGILASCVLTYRFDGQPSSTHISDGPSVPTAFFRPFRTDLESWHVCCTEVYIVLPGGSSSMLDTIEHMVPGGWSCAVYLRSCTTYHNRRWGSRS